MRKKLLKVVIFILINIVIFLVADYVFAYCQHKIKMLETKKMVLESGATENDSWIWSVPFHYTYKYYPFEDWYKKEVNTNLAKERTYGDKSYKKAPILVFGCSLAEGTVLLRYNEKFEYYLSEQSKRMVFNYGYGGMGPEAMLYTTETDDMYNYVDSVTSAQPEYAIYIYIYGHAGRIYNNKYQLHQFDHLQIGYDQHKGKLVHKKNIIMFFTRFAIFKYLFIRFVENSPEFYKKYGSLMHKYFLQSREELRKRYPNIKFVIIKHPVNYGGRDLLNNANEISPQIWKQMEDEGFIIYNIDDHVNVDIAEEKYRFPDSHPRKECWEVVVPQLIKDLNL